MWPGRVSLAHLPVKDLEMWLNMDKTNHVGFNQSAVHMDFQAAKNCHIRPRCELLDP